MNKDLFKILKELRDIEPGTDYSQKSKKMLLLEIERGSVYKFKFSDVLAGLYPRKFILGAVSAVVLLLIISGGVYYLTEPSNQSDLVVKASEANASIQVKLNEIQYLLEHQNQLDSSQVSAIQDMLQSVADDLKAAADLKPEELDKSLERIKSAENMLYQIDQLTK